MTSRSPERQRASIQSVQRAATILDLFTPTRPRWTVAEITERLGASRATTHRYIVALREAALLKYDPASGGYSLGPQVLRLSAAALAGLPVVRIAGPLMRELAEAVNETVVLSVWDGEGPVIVRVEGATERLVHIVIRTGARLPAETSAQGKVFLAFLEGADAGSDPALERELEAIRTAGVAVSDEVEPGIRAVSAPVFGRNGDPVAALSVVGTVTSIPDDVASLQAVALYEAAKALSEGVGGVADQHVR